MVASTVKNGNDRLRKGNRHRLLFIVNEVELHFNGIKQAHEV